jgi:branched-chain amino acid transport system substrate-binding protein
VTLPSGLALSALRIASTWSAAMKNGFEKISNFTLGGLVPPLKITPTDHEGGGLVQIWQVKGGKFEKVTDWYAAYPDVVTKHIKAAAAK